MSILWRILGYIRPYFWAAAIAFLSLIGTSVLSIAVPRILEDVVDTGLGTCHPFCFSQHYRGFLENVVSVPVESGDSTFMFQAGLLIIGLGVLRGITGFATRYFSEWLANRVAYDMRNQLYDHVLHLSFGYHDTAQTGQLITRAISDVDEVRNYLAYALVDGLNVVSLTVGATAMMLATDVPLTLISLLPLVPLAIIAVRFGGIVRRRFRRVMDRLSRLGEILEENLVSVQVVRAFARESYETGRFAEANEILYGERLRLIRTWGTYLPFMNLIIAFSTLLVLWFGARMVNDPDSGVTVGTVVAFNAYILMMARPLQFFGFVIMLTTQAIASGERVFEILDAPVEIQDEESSIMPPPLRGEVRFVDVSFHYPDSAIDVLKDITLEARPGQVTALLGATGSGKSTLVSLIPRFYDVVRGQVLVDGYDVRQLPLAFWRKQIGVVLQESLLFSATIRENIAFGHPDAPDDEIFRAAKAANAHEFIQGFPDGYDTLVGERGVTLSGGQRQRIAIARALVMDPRILILDDSASSVDTQTEHLIQEALAKLMKGRTTFVIAQRLTTVQKADQILVLDQGEIVERGTHQELLARGGIYRDIYRLQLEDQERLRHQLMAMGGLYEAS